jgi:hypothetical protein
MPGEMQGRSAPRRNLRDVIDTSWHTAHKGTWLSLVGLALFVAVARWYGGWQWSAIAQAVAFSVVGLWVLERLVRVAEIDARSRLYVGRVWTFSMDASKAFIEGRLRLSRASERAESPGVFWKALTTSDLLRELKIEDFGHHIRVHRWLASPGEELRQYEWWDETDVGHWEDPRTGIDLWSYSTEEASGVARLSATWRWDARRRHPFVQLTWWIDHPPGEDATTAPAVDIVFTVPLDPNRLDEECVQSVYVKGRKRPPGRATPYPLDDNHWEKRLGDGESFQWAWYLRVQAFELKG